MGGESLQRYLVASRRAVAKTPSVCVLVKLRIWGVFMRTAWSINRSGGRMPEKQITTRAAASADPFSDDGDS